MPHAIILGMDSSNHFHTPVRNGWFAFQNKWLPVNHTFVTVCWYCEPIWYENDGLSINVASPTRFPLIARYKSLWLIDSNAKQSLRATAVKNFRFLRHYVAYNAPTNHRRNFDLRVATQPNRSQSAFRPLTRKCDPIWPCFETPTPNCSPGETGVIGMGNVGVFFWSMNGTVWYLVNREKTLIVICGYKQIIKFRV